MAVTTATEAADGLALERPTAPCLAENGSCGALKVRQVTFSEEASLHGLFCMSRAYQLPQLPHETAWESSEDVNIKLSQVETHEFQGEEALPGRMAQFKVWRCG